MKAIAVFDKKLKGIVNFEQINNSVLVVGEIRGLKPNSFHGLHIHTYGDHTNNCMSAGGHFNPHNAIHGDRTDNKMNRHVGDLGNIKTNGWGIARFRFQDKIISLDFRKKSCIIGRSLIVHSHRDDLGRGPNKESLKTGNAGKRLDCCVIGIAKS